MKKSKITILLTMLINMVGTNTLAQAIEVKNADGVTIYYNWINDKTELEVTYNVNNYKYDEGSYSGDVVIPESVEYEKKTYNVTSIGLMTFRYCKDELTSVTIPNSVTSIGNYAFWDCSGLTSITIPNSVKSIGEGTFNGCTGLASITIPSGVKTIYQGTFSNCNNLVSLIIPESVTNIAYRAFEETPWYNDLYDKHPDGVVYIGKIAYEYKGNISESTEIEFKDGTVSISGAFRNCNITSVTIPNSVIYIDKNTFLGCNDISSIKVGNDNARYDSRDNCNAIIETSTNTLIHGCKNTVIPNDVKSIGERAFYGCSDMTSIIIPESVTSIGRWAFSSCNSLTSFTIPNNVTTIDEYAFWNCSGLTSVTIGNGVNSMGTYAFASCSSLTSVNISNGVTCIGENAFRDCKGLNSITIPNSVTSIGSSAFWGCKGLTSITIPKSVTSIGANAFWLCRFNSVTIDLKEPLSYSYNMFTYITNTTLYVPRSSKEAYAVADQWNEFKEIKEFVRKESTTYAVETDNTLSVGVVDQTDKEVEIYESVNVDGKDLPVKAIADNAFAGNTVIKKVSIPESVEEIGESAFAECINLRAIYCNATEPIDLSSKEATVRSRSESKEVTASDVFTNVDKRKCILYVPIASIEKYKAAEGWNEFQHIVGIGDLLSGDANGNTNVEATDIDAVRDFILTDEESEGFKYQNADADGDGNVNVADIVNILNIIENKTQKAD